mmetsp:Transcript_6799/g.17077  ORF Transcript_6799/g.17077 Transcript_6799/m.17077 type:complete len:224 (+) Transcript_6799:415-1086(+)
MRTLQAHSTASFGGLPGLLCEFPSQAAAIDNCPIPAGSDVDKQHTSVRVDTATAEGSSSSLGRARDVLDIGIATTIAVATAATASAGASSADAGGSASACTTDGGELRQRTRGVMCRGCSGCHPRRARGCRVAEGHAVELAAPEDGGAEEEGAGHHGSQDGKDSIEDSEAEEDDGRCISSIGAILPTRKLGPSTRDVFRPEGQEPQHDKLQYSCERRVTLTAK